MRRPPLATASMSMNTINVVFIIGRQFIRMTSFECMQLDNKYKNSRYHRGNIKEKKIPQTDNICITR